MGALMMARPTA